MTNNVLKKILITAKAKMSLWLVDPVEAIRFDSFVYAFLKQSTIDYQKYTLLFRFDYNDETQSMWRVFVLLKDNRWELTEMPNPFYKVKDNECYFYPNWAA